MTIGPRIVTSLLVLLAAAGVASAQCVECDADGEPGVNSSYSSVDVGAVSDEAMGYVDTDWSVADSDHPSGFWVWISLCFGAFVEKLEHALGLESGVEGNVELFAGENGMDLDGAVGDLSFEDSPAGELDDATWQHMGEMPVDLPAMPAGGESMPETDVDVCVLVSVAVPCN